MQPSIPESERAEYQAEVARVRAEITEGLGSEMFRNTEGCLVKMNWSSTVDAEFVSQSLACTTADEVFLQLKASSRVSDDLHEAYAPGYGTLEALQNKDSF